MIKVPERIGGIDYSRRVSRRLEFLRPKRPVFCISGGRRRFESDPALVRRQGLDELAEGVDEILDFVVVVIETSFEFRKFRHYVLISRQGLAHLHEGAHDEDAHFDGALRVEYAGRHERSVLGKGVWQITTAATARVWGHNL